MPPATEPAVSKIFAGPVAVVGGIVTATVNAELAPWGCTVATGPMWYFDWSTS